MIKSTHTKEQYVLRLKKFFRFLKLERLDPIEEQCRQFMGLEKRGGGSWTLSVTMGYIRSLRQRVDKKEIGFSTARNLIKPIKLFYDE